ncbi:hypothetical protein E1B28_005339 [Marasmius oreades]|uniref:Uncharacterized protein n=1 Tax=Marasmius oreades TaxID=181124 RepID=A0A9P7S3I6_9AGAR|nr:uncharacterized protein E1B28_005339 [Marasmius oreades]KAG7094508.1 hypothetical protein E1B28_005339 [Marasmius oreades]
MRQDYLYGVAADVETSSTLFAQSLSPTTFSRSKAVPPNRLAKKNPLLPRYHPAVTSVGNQYISHLTSTPIREVYTPSRTEQQAFPLLFAKLERLSTATGR